MRERGKRRGGEEGKGRPQRLDEPLFQFWTLPARKKREEEGEDGKKAVS